jgi:hypothetical protein
MLRKELETFTDIESGLLDDGCMGEEKDYPFIPWESEVDGSDIDMLWIVKETGLRNNVFVDRQSVKDNSIILTDTHVVYEKDGEEKEIIDAEQKSVIGVDWGRTPAKEARLYWINFEYCQYGFDGTS